MDAFNNAANAVQNAENVIITAGAGMGVDSGLPDFRGNEGFWRAYPALRGYPFEEMANPQWFHSDPHRAWGFYGHRLNLYRSTIPHQGFDILQKWAESRQTFVYTSNVDGAFQKAGFSDAQIVECHGSLHHVQYVDTANGTEIWSADGINVDVDEVQVLASDPLPRKNGHLLRPNVLMFGDWDWQDQRSSEQRRRLSTWLKSIAMQKTVVIEMGAGTTIPSVRRFSQSIQSLGATLIRINPRESFGPEGTISLASGAKDALLKIDSLL